MMLTNALVRPDFLAYELACLLLSAATAANAAFYAELFPTSVRSRGVAIPYGLGIAVFGGTAPLLDTWLPSIGLQQVFTVYALRTFQKPRNGTASLPRLTDSSGPVVARGPGRRRSRPAPAALTDRMLILSQRHPRAVLAEYVRHRNGRRLHRSRELRPPRSACPVADLDSQRIKRQRLLGGLINEYERAA